MILLLLSSASSQYAMPFGGGCGGCPQPMCAPRPACAPPVVCPPPAPCPPQFCPPPPICPPPIQCPVCPPPLPPPPPPPCSCQMARPMYYPVAYPSYGGGCGGQPAQIPMPTLPSSNDCCCGCSSPCRYKGRARKAAGVKTIDPSCNSEELRKIIEESIFSEDASESKRVIQVKAEQTLGHMVNVICGKGSFSYLAHTETFCQATRDDITCYAFKPL